MNMKSKLGLTLVAAALMTVYGCGKEEAKKAEAPKIYRKELISVIRMMLDLETDISEDKVDALKADLKLITEKSLEAHKALGIKEEDD